MANQDPTKPNPFTSHGEERVGGDKLSKAGKVSGDAHVPQSTQSEGSQTGTPQKFYSTIHQGSDIKNEATAGKVAAAGEQGPTGAEASEGQAVGFAQAESEDLGTTAQDRATPTSEQAATRAPLTNETETTGGTATPPAEEQAATLQNRGQPKTATEATIPGESAATATRVEATTESSVTAQTPESVAGTPPPTIVEAEATATDSTQAVSSESNVQPQPESGLKAPTIDVVSSSGVEDTPIPVEINVTSNSTDVSGETILIVIGGVPLNASLSAGINNGDGTWTLTQEQLDGLTLSPPANSNADITLTVNAIASSGSETAETTVPATVDITGVADAPSVTASNVAGTESEGIALNLEATLTDVDGSEFISSIVISDVPVGGSFSAGIDNGDGTWSLSPADLANLQFFPPIGIEDYTMNVSATTTESDGDMATTLASFDVSVSAGGDIIIGTNSAETLYGTKYSDTIDARGGNDTIYAGTGDDIILGGSGNDVIYGEAGNDIITGGTGADALYGGAGDDIFETQGSWDTGSTISGGEGFDTIQNIGTGNITMSNFGPGQSIEEIQGAGEDIIGTSGANILDFSQTTLTDVGKIDAGGGADTVHGSQAADVIEGGGGADVIYGEGGADTLYGESGNDTIFGGEGDDVIRGGSGDDILSGGAGDDTFLTRGSEDAGSTISGGEGYDLIENVGSGNIIMKNFGPDQSIEEIKAGGANIHGSGGADTLDFSETTLTGVNEIQGRGGHDTITGSQGADVIKGDAGDDVLSGQAGDDTIYGGKGNDTITGGAGDDVLYGEQGDDSFVFNLNDQTGNDIVSGGGGNKWTDTIQLDNADAGPGSHSNWTLTVGGVEVVENPLSPFPGEIDLGNNAEGTITFENGDTITFTDIEKITW